MPVTLSQERLRRIATLDPRKIYVENVRSVLGVPHAFARQFCETAVRQGVFAKRIEVVCPDGGVAISATSEDELPPTVTCWAEEDGNFREREYPTVSLDKTVFYQLCQ